MSALTVVRTENHPRNLCPSSRFIWEPHVRSQPWATVYHDSAGYSLYWAWRDGIFHHLGIVEPFPTLEAAQACWNRMKDQDAIPLTPGTMTDPDIG